jgi:DNA-binding transcriptional ArsR family regulator
VVESRAGELDAVLGALRAPARREILALIWDRELAAGEIAAAFSLTQPTISEHLAVLRRAGLVDVTHVGTSRRYRARQTALDGLHGALESPLKWVPATGAVERHPAEVSTRGVVIVKVEVPTSQQITFEAFTDPALYSQWLGSPVSIVDGRFAATMEWGTEVRGWYDLVVPPELIVMRWDFDDENVPVPGRPLTGYLRAHQAQRGSIVEVHQLVDTPEQATFMEAAWGMVLSRLRTGVASATGNEPVTVRPRRAKTRRGA